MSTSLTDLQTEVYRNLAVDPTKSGTGIYSTASVNSALNDTQRFIVKSAVPASLGELVKHTTHVCSWVTVSGPLEFSKTAGGKGRLLGFALGADFGQDIPFLSLEQWQDRGKTEAWTTTKFVDYVAVDMGDSVMIRPWPPSADFPVSFKESYIDDPTDMGVAIGGITCIAMTLPDDWKGWLCLCTAWLLATKAREYEKANGIKTLMAEWSAGFRDKWGVNPPSAAAPAASGKVV
jgi:hypothetical protein